MFKNWTKKTWLLYGFGIIATLLILLALKINIVLTMILAFVLEIIVLYYTMVNEKQMEKGVIFSYVSILTVIMVTMWIWQYFDWPPSIWEAMIVGIGFILFSIDIYAVFQYLINREKLSFYLHKQVFTTWIVKFLANIIIPMIRLKSIHPAIGYTILAVLVLGTWTDIVHELGLNYGS